jgi:hypothetical protein
MTKKAWIGAALLLTAAAAWGQDAGFESVNTSEGLYYVSVMYMGDSGDFLTPEVMAEFASDVTLTKGQWEAVNAILGRHDTARGDTYFIILCRDPKGYDGFSLVCEFTSARQYRYLIMAK